MANGDALIGQPDPTGGVAQADTERVARGLVGDDLVNRYGDVIGARRATAADALRDFALGTTKGADAVTGMKLQVRKAYEDRQIQAERAGVARAAQAREQVAGWGRLITQSKLMPKTIRKKYIETGLSKLGLPEADPLFIAAATDPDIPLADALSDPKVQELLNSDPFEAQALITKMTGDGHAALAYVQQYQQLKAQNKTAENDALVLKLNKLKLVKGMEDAYRAAGPVGLAQARETEKLKLKTDRLAYKERKIKLKTAEKKLAGGGSKGLTGIPEIDAQLSGGSTPPASGITVTREE